MPILHTAICAETSQICFCMHSATSAKKRFGMEIKMNTLRFQTACDHVLQLQQKGTLIGTLSEKTIHAVLKYYLEPNVSYHEIRVGSFFADVKNEQGIFEIQTRQFHRLRDKLALFLEEYPVTVVYPIVHHNYLRWIEPETGQIHPPRCSPKIGTIYHVLPELYQIKLFLNHPNFRLKLILLDVSEYRYLDGYGSDRKKRATRCDKIPSAILAEEDFYTQTDFVKFLPNSLPTPFTSRDYHLATKLPAKVASTALHVLHEKQIIARTGKCGNAFLYKRTILSHSTDTI